MMKNEDGFHFAKMRWRVTVRKSARAAAFPSAAMTQERTFGGSYSCPRSGRSFIAFYNDVTVAVGHVIRHSTPSDFSPLKLIPLATATTGNVLQVSVLSNLA